MTDQNIRLTFRGGGWVLVMTGIVLLGIVAWAIAPAVLRMTNLPPGDNQTIESYKFDLSNLQISRDLVVPAMRHRNMSPVVTEPIILSPEEIKQRNSSKRDPLVVSKDIVVGITMNGETRAYPLHFLHVHEIVNDTLGGVPISIIWHWPSGHLAVFERTIGSSDLQFANSGLVGNGGMLFYPLQEEVGGEQLFASMLGRSMSGDDVSLVQVPHDLVSWKNWSTQHPNTTALGPNKQLKKRYRKASPELYFRTEKIYFPVAQMPESELNPKTPIIVLHIDGSDFVYSIPALLEVAGDDGLFQDPNNFHAFTVQDNPMTVLVQNPQGQNALTSTALWFAWHANHPDATITSLSQE